MAQGLHAWARPTCGDGCIWCLSYSPQPQAPSRPPRQGPASPMTPLTVNRTRPLCHRRSLCRQGPSHPAVSMHPHRARCPSQAKDLAVFPRSCPWPPDPHEPHPRALCWLGWQKVTVALTAAVHGQLLGYSCDTPASAVCVIVRWEHTHLCVHVQISTARGPRGTAATGQDPAGESCKVPVCRRGAGLSILCFPCRGGGQAGQPWAVRAAGR